MTGRYKIFIWAVALFVSAQFFLASCSSAENSKVEIYVDRALIPSMKAENLKTIYTDSGKIVYRIEAPEWLVYDKAEKPYWDLPKGGVFERMLDSVNVESRIQCKQAKFFVQDKLWELRDQVKAVNDKNELFETELLFWDQKAKRIYTDRFVKITTATQWMTGYEFEANQDLTKYLFKRSQGLIESNE